MLCYFLDKDKVKVHLKDFEVSRNNKAFNAISLKADDQLVGAKLSNGFGDILIVTDFGLASKYKRK